MGDLVDALFPNLSDQERAELEAASADRQEHFGQRSCPERCGCTEFFDDREPDTVTGGFGVAGCTCARCNGDALSSRQGTGLDSADSRVQP